MLAACLLLTGGAPLDAQPRPAPSKAEEEVKAQIDKARGLAEEGKADAAVEILQKFITASPQSEHIPAAYLLLGKVLSDQKNYEEAGAYYRRLLEEYPASELRPQARLGLIAALLTTGQLNAALPLLLEAKGQTTDPAVKRIVLRQLEEVFLANEDYVRMVETAVEARALASEEERRPIEQRIAEVLKSRVGEKDLRHFVDKYPRTFPSDIALLRLMELYESASEDYKLARAARDFLTQFPLHEQAPSVDAFLTAQRKKLMSMAYRIGALLPLSGALSPYGTDVLNGIRIAFDQTTQAIPQLAVGLVTKDTEGDPLTLASELDDLLNEYQPIAVIGPLLSREVKAVAAAADAYEVVFITPTATLADVQLLGQYLFNTAVNSRALVRDLATYATGPLGWKRFCILAPRDQYGAEMTQAFAEEIHRLGGEIIAVDTYRPDDNDFGPPLKRIKEADLKRYGKMESPPTPPQKSPSTPPQRKGAKETKIYVPGFDAIFLPGEAQKVSLIAGQIRFYAAKVGLLGTNGMDTPELLQFDARAVEEAIFADSFLVDSPDPAVRHFVDQYRKRFQQPPTAFAAQAYEATTLVLDGILKGATTGRALRESVKNVKDAPGLIGTLTMNPAGYLERRYVLIQVKNGRLVPLMDMR
jgi:ABC-type branched-subunit amino acid transport system substrate-binding protein/predicted negative regulator of RcsB-dependent stress response